MLSADTTVTSSLLGGSNPHCLRTEEARSPLPLSRRESEDRFLVCSAGVEPATDGSSSRPLYRSWSTSTWSRRPVPTRAIRSTKAEPQPCAAAKLGNQGSNLDSSGSEPDVLPDYTIPHGTACAARDSNSVRRIKSPEHHHLCLRHWRAVPGIETSTVTWLPLNRTGTSPVSTGRSSR